MHLKFFIPIQLLPYIHLARLHKPVGIFLLLWPCFFGLAIGHACFFDYLLFFIGAVVTRSAGCIINDLADKDFDSKVKRTKLRPIAAKLLTKKQALIEISIFLSISIFLWLHLSEIAKYISIVAACMILIYPFMKRLTNWPQLFLGFTFNIGLLIAVAHSSTLVLTWKFLSLFISLILWTIFYDTIYAFADIKDDLKIGIKSTAIIMSSSPKVWLSLINVFLHLFLIMFLGLKGIIPACIGLLFLQNLLVQWNPNDPDSCIKIFTRCHFWGLMEWLWLEIIRIISP